MPYRKNVFEQGGCYHIFNRGANRDAIFQSDENYRYFLRLLHAHLRPAGIELVCYCLMPNHFHLLLLQGGAIGISQFMHGTMSAYTQAYNKQNQRTGTLFEGRFKHVVVAKLETILRLMMYIHLNPVKGRLIRQPEEWEYSDYRSWTSELPESSTADITTEAFGKMRRWREEFVLPGAQEYHLRCKAYLSELENDTLLQKMILE